MWEPLLEFSSLFNECGSRLAAVGQQGSPRQAAASRCDRRGGPPKLTGLGSRATGDKHRDTPTRQSFDGLADPTIGWSACTFACLSGVVRTAIIVMPDRTDLRFDQRPSGPYPVPPQPDSREAAGSPPAASHSGHSAPVPVTGDENVVSESGEITFQKGPIEGSK